MKKIFGSLVVMALAVPTFGETLTESIQNRLGLDISNITVGEKLAPRQLLPVQKQMQAPPVELPTKMVQAPFQAPSKLSAVSTQTHFCTLIPGRAIRVARRGDRAERAAAAIEARAGTRAAQGRTLLEVVMAESGGRTVMEATNCSTCNTGPAPQITLTNLTTRELLEGGSINRQVRTINEPGVCGSGGNCSGGRRGLFRR